jgi:hypothetical protein
MSPIAQKATRIEMSGSWPFEKGVSNPSAAASFTDQSPPELSAVNCPGADLKDVLAIRWLCFHTSDCWRIEYRRVPLFSGQTTHEETSVFCAERITVRFVTFVRRLRNQRSVGEPSRVPARQGPLGASGGDLAASYRSLESELSADNSGRALILGLGLSRTS